MIHFICRGHKNVLALHRSTLEFTHSKDLTLNGDCILAVCANYNLTAIKKSGLSTINIIMRCGNLVETLEAVYNPTFNSSHEMVIRTSDYTDARTFAVKATKAAKDIDRAFVAEMQNPKAILKVMITDRSSTNQRLFYKPHYVPVIL